MSIRVLKTARRPKTGCPVPGLASGKPGPLSPVTSEIDDQSNEDVSLISSQS